MNSKEELFENWYCEKGFPELPNADFASIKAAFIQGWAFGRAEAKADRPQTPPAPIPERSRYRVQKKVSLDDPRQSTEAQIRFIHNLLSKRIITVWVNKTVFNATPRHCEFLKPIMPYIQEGEFDLSKLTVGRASQVIDLFKKT